MIDKDTLNYLCCFGVMFFRKDSEGNDFYFSSEKENEVPASIVDTSGMPECEGVSIQKSITME